MIYTQLILIEKKRRNCINTTQLAVNNSLSRRVKKNCEKDVSGFACFFFELWSLASFISVLNEMCTQQNSRISQCKQKNMKYEREGEGEREKSDFFY